MKEPLPIIPRPVSQRWRDIRLRHIPVLVYVAGIVAVIYLWNTQWMPSSFTGEVQANTASVASPMNGQFADVKVKQFDRVTKGQILGKVTLTPEMEKAETEAIRADLQVMRARMIQDQRRNDQNYQQLLAERMEQKARLDLVLFDMRYVQTDLVRTQQLRSDEYINRLIAQVKDRENLIAEMDQALDLMKPKTLSDSEPEIAEAIEAATKAKEEKFKQSSETLLRAPIDGVVTKVYRNDGENVRSGEPLIAISSERSENIVGFIRQPISFEPKVGDKVVVRTRRGTQRHAAEAQIVKVGGRLEFFTQSLRVRGFDSSQERGLPVLINAPEDLALYPGELVDLALKN